MWVRWLSAASIPPVIFAACIARQPDWTVHESRGSPQRGGHAVSLADFLACCLLLTCIACTAPDGNASTLRAPVCSPESTGVDVSLATVSGSSYLGRGWGQCFMATD